MKLYIMLPFERVVWASLDFDFLTASLTQDYTGCFKTMGIYKFKPECYSAATKCPSFEHPTVRNSHVYTLVDPETLSLC